MIHSYVCQMDPFQRTILVASVTPPNTETSIKMAPTDETKKPSDDSLATIGDTWKTSNVGLPAVLKFFTQRRAAQKWEGEKKTVQWCHSGWGTSRGGSPVAAALGAI